MKPFRSMIDDRYPLLFDGAIGTELYKRGIFINRSFEEANLVNKAMVRTLHDDYRKSGADVLTANSWGANRYKLKGHNLQEKAHAINFEAARIAREAAAEELYVAGSVGPLGLGMEPAGPVSVGEAFAAFREQIRGLAEGGVDLIILETFADIAEMHQAILAVQSVDRSLPICACLSIDLPADSALGSPLESSIPKLVEWGADIVGLNCSTGPQPMLSAMKRIKALTAAPLIAQPNSGLPREVDGRRIYKATPEYFAEFARYFLQEGVQFVGGCCGTGPEHIRAMAQAMRQYRAMSGGEGRLVSVARGDPAPAVAEGLPESPRLPFAEKSKWTAKIARGEKVCTIELVPPSGITAERMLANAESIKEAGIDAINIPDGPRASSRMSAIVTAIMIEQRVGIETILHYTCRDRNLVGMQADLLGAHAIGLRNLLCITGDPPKLGDYPNATGVFDIDAIGLVRMVHRLNGGIDIGNKQIGEPTALSIGVGVNPVHPDFDFEMDRFRRKVDAGAEWAITQPVFDVEAMEAFLEYAYKHSLSIPVIMGIWPLTSLRNAQFMNSEVPGIRIPDSIMERMAGADSPQAAASAGVDIAREMFERMIGKIQGAQLSAPFGRVDHALRVLGKA